MKEKSEFLRRYKMPREKVVTREILLDTLSVVKRIQETQRFTRSISRDCIRCAYMELCRAELNGFDTTMMRKTNYRIEEEDYVVGGNIGAEDVEDEHSEDD
jgi:hypothetical protein